MFFSSFLIFIFSLLSLFFFSRLLTRNLYHLFYLLTGNKNLSVHLLAYFLLPGTLVHEISHLFMAGILGVATGELSIIPQIEDKEVKVGALKIQKTDPFRRTLIGFSPLLMGTLLLFFLNSFFLKLEALSLAKILNLLNLPFNLVFLYLILAISSSMFSSKKDLEAVLIPVFVIFCFLIAFAFSGFKISFSQEIINHSLSFINKINVVFLLAVLLETVFVLTIRVFLLLLRPLRLS